MYAKTDDPDLLSKIANKKEFAILSHAEPSDPKGKIYNIDDDIKQGNYLFSHPYQQYIERLMSPHTDYNRILISWQTGAGKTIPCIRIAINVLDYQVEHLPFDKMGSIYVLGFSHAAFKKELFQHPELGFISREELNYYHEIQRQAQTSHSEIHRNMLYEFVQKVKRRFSSKGSHRSRFIFMGYKQFTNRLFIKNPKYLDVQMSSSSSPDEELPMMVSDQESIYETVNISGMNESEIAEAIKSGRIILNEQLIEEMRNSVIICDESHKIYNSETKNNWGIAISTVLNRKNLNIRSIFVSATPLNNSPTEIIDLINLLNPDAGVKRDDLFYESGALRPGTIEKIGHFTQGRVSFLQDQDPQFYPKRTIHGSIIPGINLLKFIRCPMTNIHYNVYKKVYNGAVPQDSQMLVDMVLPDGLYQSSQIINTLTSASVGWKEKHGIDYQNGLIVGPILERKNIGVYSAKYAKMLDIIGTILKRPKSGKIFLYHDSVYMSGVLLIQEILKRNGIIDNTSPPTEDTLCSICGRQKRYHKNLESKISTISTTGNDAAPIPSIDLVQIIETTGGGTSHIFKPVRFIIAHSDIDKSEINRDIETFNHPDNLYGENIRIIVGSQMMKESYDLKAGRSCIVVRRSENITSLIQIMGRLYRNYSHRGLPHNEWTVDYYILTSSLPDGGLGYEEEMYKRKIEQFEIIRQILRAMHIYAVDSTINFDKISKSFDSPLTIGLDILPYKPKQHVAAKGNIDEDTYKILYLDQEVDMMVSTIKRIFIEWSTVWKFDDLWKFINHMPNLGVKPEMLSKECFAAALSRLVGGSGSWVGNVESNDFVEAIFDPHGIVFYYPTIWGGGKVSIQMVGEYYILLPLDGKHPDLMYRHTQVNKVELKISLNDYVDGAVSMDEEWDDFVATNSEKKFEELNGILCSYSLDFHEFILQRVIATINRIMSHLVKEDQLWLIMFYIRLLHVYDMMGIIIWASQESQLNAKYKEWIAPPCGFGTYPCKATDLIPQTGTSKCAWCPGSVLKLYHNKIKTMQLSIRRKGKVDARIYPVGYTLQRSYLFNPRNADWMQYTIQKVTYPENDIIVGYDERSEDELVVRFKIRNPVHKMTKHQDIRKAEKGTACSSKSKEFLHDVAKKLGISTDGNVQDLCSNIRSRLMYKEIEARAGPDRKRWFYYVYENGGI